MNRLKVIFTITILITTLSLAYGSRSQGVHRLYSEGGDSLELLIVGDKLFLTDSIVLKYIEEKDIYYHCKVFNPKPANWELSKKEYTVSLIRKDEKIIKAFLTLKTYLHDKEPVNSFTKRYYSGEQKRGIKKLKLKLVETYKNRESYRGKLEREIEKSREPYKELELINNNDGTIWFIDPKWPDFSFHLAQNYSRRSNYCGTSQFGSSLHDYCYVNLELSSTHVTIYYREAGDWGESSFAARYKIISQSEQAPTLLNSKLEKL